jgi:membrane-associated protease RseP (regulator of RpoE activity)
MNPQIKSALIHTVLFLATFVTATMAGAEWTYGRSVFLPDYSWQDFFSGLPYSVSFLLILTVHEFGHYFTAKSYRIKTSLPYYIPLPPLPFFLGTLGALIRIRDRVRSKQQHFDIGIAGPLAGFIAAIGILWYGFTHLPPAEYIFQFHPEYEQYGLDYAQYVYRPELMKEGTADVIVGKNLLFLFFEKFVGNPKRVPNVHEIMHYPLLFAGFLSLVFTGINLLPIGQLDGGHVLYGLIGYEKHKKVAAAIYMLFLFYAGLGYISPGEPTEELLWRIPLFIGFNYLCLTGLKVSKINTLMFALGIFAIQYLLATAFPGLHGYSGWLLFVFLIGRFVGIAHPPSEIEEPLNDTRKILGWLALLIFVLCFTPNPIEVFFTAAP